MAVLVVVGMAMPQPLSRAAGNDGGPMGSHYGGYEDLRPHGQPGAGFRDFTDSSSR